MIVKNIALILLSLVVLASVILNIRLYAFIQKQKVTSPNGLPRNQNALDVFPDSIGVNSRLRGLINSKVERVIDGDTFDIGTDERIRLYEIDAPEYPTGCLATDAKDRLEGLILGKDVYYQKVGKDNFGRILAYVFSGDLLMNEIMVEEGLAYFIKGKTQTSYSLQIETDEKKAKLAGRGVWSALCQTKKEGCMIKGNYRPADNTRIYHTPDCYNYAKITIKPGTSDRWFCTEQEASKSGFVKSKDCPK